MVYPLVRELAGDGIPVTVTCRVLKIARQPCYRWLADPVTDAELAAAYRANALFDAHKDDPEFGYRYLADEARDAGQDMCERTARRLCSQDGWWCAFGKKRGKNGQVARASGARRPGRARLHSARTEPAVAGRHHRAPHGRGHALPVRGQGRLLQPDRGLLDQRPDGVTPGRRCPEQCLRPAR